MMWLSALLLLQAAAPARVPLLDETIRIPPSKYGVVDVMMRKEPGTVECEFAVKQGGSGGVRLAFMTREQAQRLLAGRSYHSLAATTYADRGRFRFPTREPGAYVLVVDQHQDERKPVDVALKVGLVFGEGPGAGAIELSREKRWLVIALSLLFLIALAAYTAARIRRALPDRKTDEPTWPYA